MTANVMTHMCQGQGHRGHLSLAKGKHGDIRTMLPHHLALLLSVGSIPTSLPPPPPGISHGATLEQRVSPGASGLEKPSPSGRAGGGA